MPDYLAEPSGPATAGVLVVHDWYGLLPHVRAACDELAAAGLAALAPDLYDGRTTTDPGQAEALMEALDNDAARARLDAATADLRERAGGGPVGGLGFSMGGFLTLLQATTGAYDAVVVYYTALDPERAAAIRCPVLLQLAEVEEFDPPEFFDGFVATLRAAGTEVRARTWPGTEHSFANRDVALHAPVQAAEAWTETIAFLRGHLAGARRTG
jgi:carboxymethylenebutenolidase